MKEKWKIENATHAFGCYPRPVALAISCEKHKDHKTYGEMATCADCWFRYYERIPRGFKGMKLKR